MYRKSYFCIIICNFLQKFMKNTFYKNAGDKLEFAYFEPIFFYRNNSILTIFIGDFEQKCEKPPSGVTPL